MNDTTYKNTRCCKMQVHRNTFQIYAINVRFFAGLICMLISNKNIAPLVQLSGITSITYTFGKTRASHPFYPQNTCIFLTKNTKIHIHKIFTIQCMYTYTRSEFIDTIYLIEGLKPLTGSHTLVAAPKHTRTANSCPPKNGFTRKPRRDNNKKLSLQCRNLK